MGTFLRKNIVFFSVATVIALASIFLLIADVMMFFTISEANEQIQVAQQEVKKAEKAANKPVKANADMINEDAEAVKAQTAILERRFGFIYRKYLLSFARKIGLTEDEVLAEFRSHFEKYTYVPPGMKEDAVQKKPFAEHFAGFKTPNDTIFSAFMESFLRKLALKMTMKKRGVKEDDEANAALLPANEDLQKVYAALKSFFQEIQEDHLTVEDLATCEFMSVKRIKQDIFACALGLPRTMLPIQCQNYLLYMQREFAAKRLIPGISSPDTISRITYDQYTTMAPKNSDIPEIMQAMPVYEDIFRQIRKEPSLELVSLEKFGPSPSSSSDKYLKYSFKARFKGPLKSVRNFVNILHDAYKENVVYVVTWVSVSGSSNPELESLKTILTAQGEALVPYMDPLRDAYAKPVVGRTTDVTADIDFEYYIFTGCRVFQYQAQN